jgi:hypothetical protein
MQIFGNSDDGHSCKKAAGARLMPITANMLYDLTACPRRVSMDMFANPADRDEVGPFIQLLWRKGAAHGHDIRDEIGIPVLDLSGFHGDEKEHLTTEAMDRKRCSAAVRHAA